MRKIFSVEEDYINARLDRWIRKRVCNIPQSLIEKDIRKGKIKVNNKKEKSSYKLRKNDKIILHNFNYQSNKNKKRLEKYIPTKTEISDSSNLFIENNENFVIINKPAGIAVQSGTKSKKNILDILKNTKEFRESQPYSVHRIDKETTGILIVAKNRKFAQLFTTMFRMRKIHKIYLGIALGQLEKEKGTFVDIIYHYEGKKKIETKAITHFNVIDSNTNYSLLKLTPETGRKHQLRKQLLMHGHPILGDKKYTYSRMGDKQNKTLMLHAYKINFSINDVKYNFLAKPPERFTKFLNQRYLKNSLL